MGIRRFLTGFMTSVMAMQKSIAPPGNHKICNGNAQEPEDRLADQYKTDGKCRGGKHGLKDDAGFFFLGQALRQRHENGQDPDGIDCGKQRYQRQQKVL
jgi:hypothetical protein